MFPLHDENRSSTRPFVNYLLITLNIVVFFYFFMQGIEVLDNAIYNLGVIPEYIILGKTLWTLLTSMFMHADLAHILGNMIYLWVFGDCIEDALGHFEYLIFYLFGGLAASFTNIASIIFTLPSLQPYWRIISLNTPAVGASGAISAILGAYLILYPKARIRTIVFYIFVQIISVPAYYYLGFWFLYQLMMGMISLTGFSSGVAFWAHIGGFVVGFLVVKAFGAKIKRRQPSAPREKTVTPFYVSPYIRTPFVDILEEEDRIRIIAELPGVEERDINLTTSRLDVDISAEHGDVRYYRRIVLPVPVIPKVEEFNFKNGVLTFTLYRLI